MDKPVLVVLAAGMGSRYGGMKQLDPVGPGGQIIIDYSIYDARRAGFEKVIFIIRKENEADFRQVIGDRLSHLMEVEYAFQSLEDLPAPDRVFLGGTSGNMDDILMMIFDKNPAARVVCTAVTLETVGEAARLFAHLTEADMVQLSVTRTRKAGRYHLMDAQNPVWIFSGEGKGHDA